MNENADITLLGIFKSCRELNEIICERLFNIWQLRHNNPSLIEQPQKQWDTKIRICNFSGYDSNSKPLGGDTVIVNPILGRRMKSSSVFDNQRSLWNNSNWS